MLLISSYKTVLFSAILIMTLALALAWHTNNNYYHFFTPVYAKIARSRGGINVHDPNLKAEVVATGLRFPTTMAFLGPNDILVNEKNNGTVQRIIDGKIQPQPVIDVSVANKVERGMIGIAVAKPNSTNGKSSPTHVFVSFTETKVEGSDICPKPSYCLPGHDPIGNRLYRYELVNNKLVNPRLLLDVAAVPGLVITVKKS
jgi:aldose sugar dehydrogenase